MTTQAQSPPPAGVPASPWSLAQDGIRRVRAGLPAAARTLWREQRHWLILGALLLVVLIWPLTWFWQIWSMPDSPLSYQPFVPLGALWLALQDRPSLEALYREMAQLFPEDSPKRRGKLWPALAGCALMVLACIGTVPPLAMVALLIMIAGVIYRVYGPFVLTALRRPLGFLLTMAPVPNVLVSASTANLQQGCAAVAGQILHAIYPQTKAFGTFIMLPGYTLEVAGPCSGVSVLFPVLVLTLWLALYRRMRVGPTLILLVAGAGIALLMNVLRIVAMGLIGLANAGLAQQLHDANSAAFTALAFYLTFLFAGLMLRPWRFPWRRKDPMEEIFSAYYAPRPAEQDDDASSSAAEDGRP